MSGKIKFFESRVFPGKSTGVVGQMKVQYLHIWWIQLSVLQYCTSTFVGVDNSHIKQDANECLHFILHNRIPIPLVLVGLSCNLLLMVPVGFSSQYLPHIICKHCIKKCSLQSAGYLCGNGLSRWPVCWCSVISRACNWGILWMGCMANSCAASTITSQITSGSMWAVSRILIYRTEAKEIKLSYKSIN